MKKTKEASARSAGGSIAPRDYADFLAGLKQQIRPRQYQALRAVNHERVALYRELGAGTGEGFALAGGEGVCVNGRPMTATRRIGIDPQPVLADNIEHSAPVRLVEPTGPLRVATRRVYFSNRDE